MDKVHIEETHLKWCTDQSPIKTETQNVAKPATSPGRFGRPTMWIEYLHIDTKTTVDIVRAWKSGVKIV